MAIPNFVWYTILNFVIYFSLVLRSAIVYFSIELGRSQERSTSALCLLPLDQTRGTLLS